MNYIRGAYQYYRDLPPINAATLTGAIDVIVIERPSTSASASDDGTAIGSGSETELACTPFHVRFGKWQILRPAEKQVTMVVNGKVIPFPMKIGEAGEAFFVCETEEDVPQELMTSPILSPTQPEAQVEKEPRQGRFGAKEKEESMTDVEPPEQPERPVSPEPPFLDLNNASAPSDPQSPAFSSVSRPSTPGSQGSRETTPPTSVSASSQLADREPDPSPSASDDQATPPAAAEGHRAGPSDAVDRAVKPPPHEVHDGPEVEYKHDVVLDMEGYHAHPDTAPNLGKEDGAEENSRARLKEGDLEAQGGEGRESRTWTERLLGKGKSDNGEGEGEDESVADAREHQRILLANRAMSEPPFAVSGEEEDPDTSLTTLRAVSEEPSDFIAPSTPNTSIQHLRSKAFSSSVPALPQLSLSEIPPSSSMPDYTWEWGSMPTPHTARPQTELDEEEKGMMGVGGKIFPNGDVFGLEVDDKRTTFELSLCGAEAVKGSEFENAAAFQSKLVTYRDFVEASSIVDHPDLVIRWDEKYITRADSSPLFPALARWRLEAAPADLTSGSPDRQPSPPASLSRAGGAGSSTWARWWLRSKTQDGVPKLPGPGQGQGSPGLTASVSVGAGLGEGLGVSGGGKVLDQLTRANSSPSPTVDSPAPIPEGLAAPLPQMPQQELQNGEPGRPTKTFAKTLRLTSEQLKQLQLKPGPNTVSFSLSTSAAVVCTARIFLWQHTDQLVVSDIDGTITKSDALGHVFTMIGRDWTHSGVAKLYTDVCRNGYKIMYLTSRAIGQADSTRDYLKGINQDNYQLPEGPVIMSPDRLIASLHREVIMRKPEVFKMACLRDIQRLFGEAKHPFYAGFGNRITDALSYRSVNIPSGRIFTIDSSGVVKMELLELAGYKSSYIHMTDLVDQMFPPVHRKWAPEFTDLNYWRAPMANIDIPDLRPPSPALSARSDASSRLSRIRNFTMGLPGSRTSIVSKSGEITPNGNGDAKPVRPTSPLVGASFTAESLIDEDDFELSRSPTGTHSMPGSMPGSPEPDSGSWMPSQPDTEDEDQEEGETEHGAEEDEWPPAKSPPGDDEFDDDLLATGEMENVPFL